jgi:hypothetical protein
MSLHRIQTALPENKEEKDTAPDGPQRDPGPATRVFQLGDSQAEIKDFLHIPAEAAHHGRFPRTRCFSRKNL